MKEEDDIRVIWSALFFDQMSGGRAMQVYPSPSPFISHCKVNITLVDPEIVSNEIQIPIFKFQMAHKTSTRRINGLHKMHINLKLQSVLI